jgi:hypothetical protein
MQGAGKARWVAATLETLGGGAVPVVRTRLDGGDRARAAMVRLGFGRDRCAGSWGA